MERKHTRENDPNKVIKFGVGIPIPKPLPYSALITKIQEIDIGEIINLRDSICIDLSEDEQVDGVYRDLEQLLLALNKFYIQTNDFRKEDDKLVWFGQNKGSFKVAIGGDGAPLGW